MQNVCGRQLIRKSLKRNFDNLREVGESNGL